MKSLSLVPALLLGCLFTAAPQGVAQSRLLDALPADTMVVLAVDDVASLKTAWAGSAIGRMWQDAAFDAVRAELAAVMGEVDGEAMGETGTSPFELLGMVSGPVCMAAVSYDPQPGDGPKDLQASSAWMFDAGDDLDAFSEGFDRFIDWFVETEGIVFKTETYGDLDVAVMVDPEKDHVELRYGYVDSVLLVTAETVSSGRDLFGEIVDGLAGETESSFSEDSPFADSVAAAPGAQARVWGDLGEFLRRTWDAAKEEGSAPPDLDMEQMGLTKLGAFAAGFELSPSGSMMTMTLGFTGLGWVQDVLLAGVAGRDPSLSRWIPDSAQSTFAMELDLGSMFDEVLGITMEEDPEEARDMISAMAEMEAEIGFHPRDDLLDNLDGQMAVFVSEVSAAEGLPVGDTSVPVNYALMLGLSDGEAMSAMLDGVVRSQGLHVARQLEEFEGYTIYSVPFFPGMTAHYAVLDDLLVLSLSPSMVKDVLRRKGNPDLPSILSVDDVKERSQDLPADRTVFTCQDATAQMMGVMESLALLPVILEGMDMEIDEDFPLLGLMDALGELDPEIVEKYYRDTYSLSSITLSSQGLVIVSTAP